LRAFAVVLRGVFYRFCCSLVRYVLAISSVILFVLLLVSYLLLVAADGWVQRGGVALLSLFSYWLLLTERALRRAWRLFYSNYVFCCSVILPFCLPRRRLGAGRGVYAGF